MHGDRALAAQRAETGPPPRPIINAIIQPTPLQSGRHEVNLCRSQHPKILPRGLPTLCYYATYPDGDVENGATGENPKGRTTKAAGF